MKSFALALTLGGSSVSAMHSWTNVTSSAGGSCVAPGTCTPPTDAKYHAQAVGPAPGNQWNINGGFCGAWSTQQNALSVGAWISQDLVRKANRAQTGIAHNMHGDTKVGYEVMPSNVAYTAASLKLSYEEWDYMQPAPQAKAFKVWLKKHLSKGRAIVWFPLCKGDGHDAYPGSAPNGGQCDHVEPMLGIWSKHPLDDATVYDDDVILHFSDQDTEPYYRPMRTLEDDLTMMGNCKDAGAGFGKNEMYPCFDQSVTYGLATTGLNVTGNVHASLAVDITAEPDVRQFQKATQIHGTVTAHGLTAGSTYSIYRYPDTASVPAGPPFAAGASHTHKFTATADTFTWADPNTFSSHSATYYLAAAGKAH